MSQASAVQPSIASKKERNDRTLRRTPHPYPEREDLMQTELCFNCKNPGHRAAECPLRTIHKLDRKRPASAKDAVGNSKLT